MRVTRCDMCSCDISRRNIFRDDNLTGMVYNVTFNASDNVYDLCKACSDKVEDFIKHSHINGEERIL